MRHARALLALLLVASAAACAESSDPVSPESGPRLTGGLIGTGNVVEAPPIGGDEILTLSADSTTQIGVGSGDTSGDSRTAGTIGTGN